jgi:tetrahydromethanopterin S-methyltransferase subunit G
MHVVMRESWTDERLDDLNAKVDVGFGRIDQRFDRLEGRSISRAEFDRRFDEVDKRLDRADERVEQIDSRLYSMSRTMVIAAITMSSSMIAGFGVLAAVLAAKL